MLFGNRSAAGTAAHRRRVMANTNAITTYEADLTSQDRMIQKEAIRNLLKELVKNDWEWVWPPPQDEPCSPADVPQVCGASAEDIQASDSTPNAAPQEPVPPTQETKDKPSPTLEAQPQDPGSASDAPNAEPGEPESTLKEVVEVEEIHNGTTNEPAWKERDEWLSNVSDDEPESTTSPAAKYLFSPISPTSPKNPFRFDNPDAVGDDIHKTERERKRRYKKRQREEMSWNNGLRCFVERRDAWTGARHVPPPPRPLKKRVSVSSGDGGSSTAVEGEDPDDEWEDDDTEIFLAPPLLPLTNSMRSNITPEAYNTIYDKVVKDSLTPSCPINLKDITRTCVVGWKRDGTWPPPPPDPAAESPKSRRRRMSVAQLFSSADKVATSEVRREKAREKENEFEKQREKERKASQGTLRKSLQRMKILGKIEKVRD